MLFAWDSGAGLALLERGTARCVAVAGQQRDLERGLGDFQGVLWRAALVSGSLACYPATRLRAGHEDWRHRRRVNAAGCVANDAIRADRHNCFVLREVGADSAETVRRGILVPLQHCAVMLSVATATCGKTGIGILAERKQRRNQWKREGREQQDG